MLLQTRPGGVAEHVRMENHSSDYSMKTILSLFVAHILLLVLACTNFSIISWLWGDFSWNCSYFTYSYRSGFGYEYSSDYSLLQVLAYLLGYGLGLPVFVYAWKRRWVLLGFCGLVLCTAGFVSFAIEASHWIWRHNLSLIASFPAIVIVLWAFWCMMASQVSTRKGRPRQK